jgi:cytochrome c
MIRRLLSTAGCMLAFAAIPSTLQAQAPTSADLAAGQRAFRACLTCHTVEEGLHRRGPSLYGVVDRRAGTQPGFQYSQAMRLSGVIWTDDNLIRYVMSRPSFMPGTRSAMASVRSADQAAQLVAYMRTVTGAR